MGDESWHAEPVSGTCSSHAATRLRQASWSALALVITLLSVPAKAHQVHVFALAEGSVIQGEAYFRGGEPVREARVRALGLSGEALGETKTDSQGKFSLTAQARTSYRLVVDAGGGHVAEYTVPADELPQSLPLRSAPANPGKNTTESSSKPQTVTLTETPSSDTQSLLERIESLNSQVAQLRKQLDRYEQKTRLRDVLGGIGYILGLMGLGGYLLAGRRGTRL